MDLTKEYQTKCGYAVEGLRKDGASGYVGFIKLRGVIFTAEWNKELYCCTSTIHTDLSELSLIEKPRTVRVKGWLNVYEGGLVGFYERRDRADTCASKDRVACIEIDQDVTYGEGLNDD